MATVNYPLLREQNNVQSLLCVQYGDYPRLRPLLWNWAPAAAWRTVAKLMSGINIADTTDFAHNVVRKASGVSGFELRTLIIVTLDQTAGPMITCNKSQFLTLSSAWEARQKTADDVGVRG